MRPLLAIGSGFVLGLGATLVLAAWFLWEQATWEGGALYWYRPIVAAGFAPPVGSRPSVVWLGDSTVLRRADGTLSYPQVLAPKLDAVGLDSHVIGSPGLDFYDYYFLMGPALDRAPRLVVVVAHLKLMGEPDTSPAGDHRKLTDLASYLPLSELPHALGLPLGAVGLLPDRLLLFQALRFEPVERGFVFLEGLRVAAQKAILPGAQAPAGRLDLQEIMERCLRSYDVDLWPPMLRMMGATIRMARTHGVAVLVVATPVPVDAMRAQGIWNEERDAARIRVIRAAVREAGGAFADLHTVLHDDEFVDNGGHMSPRGAEHVAALLEPGVLRLAAP